MPQSGLISITSHKKFFSDVQKELQDFLKKEENSDITDSTVLLKKFEIDTKRLAAENERLSADLKNIERDEEFAKEERTELEAKISEQTSEIEELRDEASDKLNIINGELEEIRRQLEEKEMEAAQVKMELHGHEESIEQVRSKFTRQLTRLVKKESAVEESRNEWQAEKSIYIKTRENHEAEVTAHSEALLAHDKIIDDVKQEIMLSEELAKIIAQEVIVEKDFSGIEVDDELLKLQAEVLKLEASADEANQVLKVAKSAIDNLQEEISTIEVRLPILESEKKLAASKRDFKAAAKASKEIKEMLAKSSRCKEELEGEALEKQQGAQKDVEACLALLEEKKAASHEKEKESGSKRMSNLAKKIINLEKLREQVCGSEEAEGNSVKSVGGFVLDSEISALMIEGDELDKKYGGWGDIMLEYANRMESGEDAEESEEDHSKSEAKDAIDEETNEQDIAEEENIENDEADIEVDTASKADAIDTFKKLMVKLSQTETDLEIAIETEEYEAAADLDDQIAEMKVTLESLGLTDSEKESALSQNTVQLCTTEEGEDEDHNNASAMVDESKDDVEELSEPPIEENQGEILEEEISPHCENGNGYHDADVNVHNSDTLTDGKLVDKVDLAEAPVQTADDSSASSLVEL